MIKNLHAMQDIWVRSLGQEDPLEKENGNPLQYSCLDNSLYRGAWQATVHGVTKSQTQLSDFYFTEHISILFQILFPCKLLQSIE